MPSRAVSYSPDGSKIAVGFGTPVRESSKQFDGKWIVLQEDDFQVCVDGYPRLFLKLYRCESVAFTAALLDCGSADQSASMEFSTPHHPVS